MWLGSQIEQIMENTNMVGRPYWCGLDYELNK